MDLITLENKLYRTKLPRLTFGAGELIDPSKKEEYFSLLDCFYYQYGGRSFDTARSYGNGTSEAMLGQWLCERKIDRSEVFISTKGGFPPANDRHGCRLDAKSLRDDLEQSLNDFGFEYFDVFLPHRDHPSVSAEEMMDTLNEFVRQKKIHFIGVSNWSCARIEEANRIAKEKNIIPVSVSQINFSLAKTTPKRLDDDTLVAMNETEYQWYLSHHFPVMAFSAQAKGFFAKLGKGDAPTPKIKSRFVSEENLLRLERVKTLSAKRGVSPGALALSYLTCNSLPTSAIFRCRTEEQLKDSMSAENIALTEQELRFLEGN